jgi:hypothetical protein
MKMIIIALGAVLLLAACQNDSKSTESIPVTPEEVCRAWQKYIDTNKFDEAKKLSTPRAVGVIESIQNMLTMGDEGLDVVETNFLEMNCVERGDTATCYFLIREEGEEFRDSFALVRVNGRWLVDLPENDEPSESEMQELFDNLESELQNRSDSLHGK